MPFLSKQQERFMWAKHPEIAKRWTKEMGSFENPKQSDSNESPSPKISRLPRLSGFKRDFGNLKPSSAARFAPRSSKTPNLEEADKEGPVSFVAHSRHTELGKPSEPKGFHKRDHDVALRKGK